jgi:predicted transcriptional regulator
VNVQDIVNLLNLEVVSGSAGLEQDVTGGYASDMLSCVMAGARTGQIWVTLQAHPNVIAVCDLLNLAGVIITEGTRPDQATIERAEERGIPVLASPETTFTVVGQLVTHGIAGDNARQGN